MKITSNLRELEVRDEGELAIK